MIYLFPSQVFTQGVSLKLLQKIVDMIPDQSMSTGEMVEAVVMRETRHLKCRFIDTLANPEEVIMSHHIICHVK